jgi:hypothetical protein
MKPTDIDYNEILDIAIDKQQNPRIKRWYQDNRDMLVGFIRDKVEAILAETESETVEEPVYKKPKWKKGTIMRSTPDGKEATEGWVSNTGWETYKDEYREDGKKKTLWYLVHGKSGLSAASRKYKKDILELVDFIEKQAPDIAYEEQDELVEIIRATPWLYELLGGTITIEEAKRLSKMTPEEIEREKETSQEAERRERIEREQQIYIASSDWGSYELHKVYPPDYDGYDEGFVTEQANKHIEADSDSGYKALVKNIGAMAAYKVLKARVRNKIEERKKMDLSVWETMVRRYFTQNIGFDLIRFYPGILAVFEHNAEQLINPTSAGIKGYNAPSSKLRAFEPTESRVYEFWRSNIPGSRSMVSLESWEGLFNDKTREILAQVIKKGVAKYVSKKYRFTVGEIYSDIVHFEKMLNRIEPGIASSYTDKKTDTPHWKQARRKEFRRLRDKISELYNKAEEANEYTTFTVSQMGEYYKKFKAATYDVYSMQVLHEGNPWETITEYDQQSGVVKLIDGRYAVISNDPFFTPSLCAVSWHMMIFQPNPNVRLPQIGEPAYEEQIQYKTSYTYHQKAPYKKISDLMLTEYAENQAYKDFAEFLRFIGYKEVDEVFGQTATQSEIKQFYKGDGEGRLVEDWGASRPPGMYKATNAGKVTFVWPEPWTYVKRKDGISVSCPLLWLDKFATGLFVDNP